MPSPKSLQKLCRQTLPLMLQQANGQKMMAAVRDVVQTDRWNSFDRFGETTATLTSRYEASGVRVEVESIPDRRADWIGPVDHPRGRRCRGRDRGCGASARRAGAGLAGESLARHPVERGDPGERRADCG